MVEKFRYYKTQYLHNFNIASVNWQTFNFGSMACNVTANFDDTWATGWEEVLPWRETIYFKNQGLDNDNATQLNIEIFFNQYRIDKFQSIGTVLANVAGTNYAMAYDTVNDIFRVNTGGAITLDAASDNHAYLEMPPFGTYPYEGSVHKYLTATLKNITNIGGNIYTFDVVAAAPVLPYRGDEQIRQMLINNLTLPRQNNASFHPPVFYQYAAVPPTTERGIILGLGETYSGDLTYDICPWWRALATADVGATLVVQQLA